MIDLPDNSPHLNYLDDDFDSEFDTSPGLQFPHCDQRIVHRPTECELCDVYPERQSLREAWGIAFTGHWEDDLESHYGHACGVMIQRRKIQCPSERDRPVETIHRWPGNRPTQDNRT